MNEEEKDGRKFAPLFLIAEPDQSGSTRICSAHHSMRVRLSSYIEGGNSKVSKPLVNITSTVDDKGIVTVVVTTERDGKATGRLSVSHDTWEGS